MGYILRHGLREDDYPHLIAWRDQLDERAAMKRAAAAVAEMAAQLKPHMPSEPEIDRFFARRTPGPKADLPGYMNKGPMFTAQPDKLATD
jgi:hypothetical protein